MSRLLESAGIRDLIPGRLEPPHGLLEPWESEGQQAVSEAPWSVEILPLNVSFNVKFRAASPQVFTL